MAGKTASLSVNIIADAAKAKAGLKEAETAFGKFRREVGESQGAMGKFKTISGSAFDAIKQNAIGFAAGAGAAIGAFVVKSVASFQNLALAAGKFSDATGLTTEQASRFIEVAGDLGVEADQVQKAIGFMNKTLGNSPDLFKQLGVNIAYASNGATDVNGTFLNVVRRLNEIPDPAQRAAMATKLLGRGWTDLAEMISLGADGLAASLASVSDAKVISPEEEANAKRLRDEVDRLKDSWENFANTIGASVIPVLADVLDFISDVGGAIGSFDKWISSAFGNGAWLTNAQNAVQQQKFLNDAWKEGYKAQIDAQSASVKLQMALEDQQLAVENARAEWDTFRGSLNFDAEYLRLEENIAQFSAKWTGMTEEAKRKSKEYQRELLGIQIQLANVALSVVGLATTAQNNRIKFYTETGQLSQALSLINAIKAGLNQLAGRVTPDRVERITGGLTAPTSASGWSSNQSKVYIPRIPGMASGGTVTAGGAVVVGENGPELLQLPRGASVNPNVNSGMVVNIRVDAGLVSSPDQVGKQIIDAIRRAERRSGQVFAGV